MTSIGMSVKVSPAVVVDPAATAVPQPGGEADAFAQLMAAVGMPAEAPAAFPAVALVVGLAAVQAPVEGEIVSAEAATKPGPNEAEKASCMIEIAGLAAKMLTIKRLGRDGEEPGTDAPKGEETEGDTPKADQDADQGPVAIPLPFVPLPVITPLPQQLSAPVRPAVDKKAAPGEILPAVQVAAASGLPKAVISDQPSADTKDTGEQAETASAPEDKPVALPAPLRLTIQNLLADKAPALARPEGQPAPAAVPANDQSVAAPLPAAPLTPSSVIAMMQSQLAAVTASSEPAPVADAAAAAPASPELAVERQLDMAKDNEWLDSLARDIASTTGRDSTLRFRLHPQSLGTLQVEVAQSHAGTSVRLTADTEAARSIIADAQPRLIAEARAQGVRIAETHVGMELGSHHASDQRRQGESRQEAFLRTAAGEAETHNEDTTRAADGSAERFA